MNVQERSFKGEGLLTPAQPTANISIETHVRELHMAPKVHDREFSLVAIDPVCGAAELFSGRFDAEQAMARLSPGFTRSA